MFIGIWFLKSNLKKLMYQSQLLAKSTPALGKLAGKFPSTMKAHHHLKGDGHPIFWPMKG